MSEYSPFCEKQVAYINRTRDCWFNTLEGGKRAGKNVVNILAWCDCIETHTDKLHLSAGVSNASAKLNIIDSNGFGLMNWFKGRCHLGKYMDRDALYVNTAMGEKIILISGGGKEGDEKYIKGNTYGSVYVTEANECAQSFIKEVFDRTLSSSDRKIYFDLNPKNPKHWFYDEVLDFHRQNHLDLDGYGVNYEHFTIFDNQSFSDEKIRQILSTYNRKSIWYKRDILGQRSSAEGIIYDMFSTDNLYTDGEGPNYDFFYRRYFAVDYGTTNPFVCLEIIEQKDPWSGITKYFLENEYFYDSRKRNRQKEDSEYVTDILEFIGDKKYNAILIDPSAASFKVAGRNRRLKIRDADNDVDDGIRLVAQALARKLFMINRRCTNTVQEFYSYIWDLKATEKGKEAPVKQFDHCMDAIRYFFKTIVRVLKAA